MNKAIRFQWAPRPSRPDAQVVLVQEGRLLAPPSLPQADRLALENWIGTTKFKGKVGAAAWPQGLPSTVLAVGIGKKKDFHAARWLRAWAAAGRALERAAVVRRASFEWPASASFPLETPELAGLAAEGLLAGEYAFEAFRTRKKEHSFAFEFAGAALASKAARAAVRRAEQVGETLREVRDLANLPANALGPMELAAGARKLARAAGLSCTVRDQAALKKEKCGALLAVAQGSRRPGCLIRLAHAGRRGLKPLVVVGKAVTFEIIGKLQDGTPMMIMILICESTPRMGLPPQSAAAVSRAQTGSSYRPASSSAVRFSRSCSGRLAPRMTLETCGFCRHQAMASGAGFSPSSAAAAA